MKANRPLEVDATGKYPGHGSYENLFTPIATRGIVTASNQEKPSHAALIRKGTAADTDSTWRLFQAHLNWINVWNDLGQVVQRRNTGEYSFQLQMLSMYPSAVAEVDGRVIGYAVTELREIDVLEVRNMYVDDPFRNKGIGLQLLEEVERQCSETEIESLIAFASTKYYDGKILPTSLFTRAGFAAHSITTHAEMYLKNLGSLNGDDEEPIRRFKIVARDTPLS